MVSQTCGQCGESVAADEQFCPNCGSFIDPMAPQRPPASGEVISVRSDGNYEEFSLAEPPPPPPPPPAEHVHVETTGKAGSGSEVTCPSCGATNPPGNRHCQECGARLDQSPLPTAPRPAVQATAGVRAALAISGLLFVVIVVALGFNIFGGDGTASSTTLEATATTQSVITEPEPVDILDQQCDPDGLGSFTCANLVSNSEAEYQVNWEEIQDAEGNIKIKLFFRQPMIVTRIDWSNIEDPTRFRRNYRARGLTLNAQGSVTEVPHELEDTPGLQTVNFAAVNANWVEITVQSAYQAEIIDDNVFRELAIAEITVWGRPSNPTTTATTGG
ncbi:MAG: zinc-ribbon domain-containing protein [Acidimicrobiia bacterium]